MILAHFAYSEGGWSIDGSLPLQQVNLLVGKNSMGKSKTIHSLGNVIALLLQQREIPKNNELHAELFFENEEDTFLYTFSCSNGIVTDEKLVATGEVRLKRDHDIATLRNEQINPPANKLILHVRRDTKLYPYIEEIMSWAEQAGGFSFNEIDIAGDHSTEFGILGEQQELFSMVKSLQDSAKHNVIKMASDLGYNITQIRPLEIGPNIRKVIFREKGVDRLLMDKALSKGMFRTLYLLIYMEFLSQQECPSLLLIDDLCEGLDYERSTLLGKLLFNFCKKHGIQLIVSSNDTFLMDVVDIEYWNILQRNGNKVTSVNKQNNPDLFRNFLFTGLSNFDFISTDYIQRHLTKSEVNE